MTKQRILHNIAVAMQEVKAVREGKMPKETWEQYIQRINSKNRDVYTDTSNVRHTQCSIIKHTYSVQKQEEF